MRTPDHPIGRGGAATSTFNSGRDYAVRFLSKWLGWSGKDFAEVMGVTPETVSRWEKGSLRTGRQAERLLRLLVATQEPRDDHPTTWLRELESDVSEPERLSVKTGRNGWRVQPAT